MNSTNLGIIVQTPAALFLAALTVIVAGCGQKAAISPDAGAASTSQAFAPSPLALALVQHDGHEQVDNEIRRYQDQVRNGRNRAAALERLGWAFVAKAHESFDPGFYKIAECCANVLESDSPGCSEGMLLRGHVLQNLHHFKEAEVIARELVTKRGLSYDFALLGDTLMEQGQLKEAAEAYQQMVNIRPGFEAYSRIAHIRWLTGDLAGAIEMMQAAVKTTSPADADTAAWAHIRLANLQFQSGDATSARQSCEAALGLRSDFPPALLLRGKLSLTKHEAGAAVRDLELAAQQNPLPEYQWALAEALRAAGREQEAADAEKDLVCRGEAADPRTLSLYLATRGQDSELAVRLAQKELAQRADVFTHDALAWALTTSGRVDEARPHFEQALAAGTQDARLFFHAAVIESRAGRMDEAQRWFNRAASMTSLLLPSERALLLELPKNFASVKTDTATDTSSAF